MLRALRLAFQALTLSHFALQGDSLAVQLHKYTDFGPQELGNDRDGNIIHCPMFVALELVKVGVMNGGDEDDGDLLIAWMLTDKCCQFKAVNLRHTHVQEDESNVGVEQVLQRLSGRTGLDQVLAQVTEND